jgi:hypothetical protein
VKTSRCDVLRRVTWIRLVEDSLVSALDSAVTSAGRLLSRYLYKDNLPLHPFTPCLRHINVPLSSIVLLYCIVVSYFLRNIFTIRLSFTKFIMPPKLPMNVQSFPRPPLLERTSRHLQVMWKGQVIADTKEAYWVLETYHPPSIHLACISLMKSNIKQHITFPHLLFSFHWKPQRDQHSVSGKAGRHTTASLYLEPRNLQMMRS